MALFQQHLIQQLGAAQGPNRSLGNAGLLQFSGPRAFGNLRDSGLMNSQTSTGPFLNPSLPQSMIHNLSALQPQALQSSDGRSKGPYGAHKYSVSGHLPPDNRTFSFMHQLPGRTGLPFEKEGPFGDFSHLTGMPNEGPSMHELVENMPQKHKMSMHLGSGKPNDK